MRKSPVYFIVPPPISAGSPLTLFSLAMALLVESGYLVFTVFIETRD